MTTTRPLDASASVTRLELSREELRLALRHCAGLDRPVRKPVQGLGWAEGLINAAKSIPVVDVAIDVVRRWWANHPLRSATLVARETVSAVAAPIAQRSPITLVVGALLAGAILSKIKPWRWLPRSLMFAGLIPQLSSRLIASVPLDAWLNAFTGPAGRPPPR